MIALLYPTLVCAGCSSPDRGGCSQLCTHVNSGEWQCGCLPGYQLHQDGKQCTAAGESYNGPPNADPLSEHYCLTGVYLCLQYNVGVEFFLFTGPRPYLLVATPVDIRKINLDGTEDQILVTEPKGRIIALDYDPVRNDVRSKGFLKIVI